MVWSTRRFLTTHSIGNINQAGLGYLFSFVNYILYLKRIMNKKGYAAAYLHIYHCYYLETEYDYTIITHQMHLGSKPTAIQCRIGFLHA